MGKSPEVIVVPGASSPYSDKYVPVYELLRAHGATVLDFVGCGHYSRRKDIRDFGTGFSIQAAARKILADLADAEAGTTLFCRSSGCDVAAHLMVEHPSLMRQFGRIIFWGATGGLDMWNDLPDDPGAITRFNKGWERMGVLLAKDFWPTYAPFEAQCIRLAGESQITLACGDGDKHTSRAEQEYFAMLINRHTNCRAAVAAIPGAGHAVPDDNSTLQVLDAYLRLIWGDGFRSACDERGQGN